MAGVPRIAAPRKRRLDDSLMARLQFRLIFIFRLWEAVRGWVQVCRGRPLDTPQHLNSRLQDEQTRLNLLGLLHHLDFRRTLGPCRTLIY